MRDPIPHWTGEEIEKLNRWDFSSGYFVRATHHLEQCPSCNEKVKDPTVEDVRRVFRISDEDYLRCCERRKKTYVKRVFDRLFKFS